MGGNQAEGINHALQSQFVQIEVLRVHLGWTEAIRSYEQPRVRFELCLHGPIALWGRDSRLERFRDQLRWLAKAVTVSPNTMQASAEL